MKRIGKWWEGLSAFGTKLAEQRGKELQAIELDLSEAVIALSDVIKLTKKFRCHITAGLAVDEWRMVYNRSMVANKKTAIVLQDRGNGWLENLAEEFNGKLF